MFAFFIGDECQGFWANKEGDIFFDITAKGMGWHLPSVALNFYPSLKEAPELYGFDESGGLIIQKKEVLTVGEIDEESIVNLETIEAVKYVISGVKVLKC